VLNDKRAGIETQTGASTYTIDDAAIAATPGGDNTLLNQVILQAPDVAQDSFGQSMSAAVTTIGSTAQRHHPAGGQSNRHLYRQQLHSPRS